MNVAPVMNVVVDNIVEMNELFTDVARGEGLAALLLAAGTILIVASVAFVGYLLVGALVDLVTPA